MQENCPVHILIAGSLIYPDFQSQHHFLLHCKCGCKLCGLSHFSTIWTLLHSCTTSVSIKCLYDETFL